MSEVNQPADGGEDVGAEIAAEWEAGRTARAFDNIRKHIEQRGDQFSSRNKTAVLSQLRDIEAELASLQVDGGAGDATVEQLEAHWVNLFNDIHRACENAAWDLENNTSGSIHPATDEAIELLRVMVHREKRLQAELAAVTAERDALRALGNESEGAK